MINIIKSSMDYQVAGILISVQQELYMTSISIKMNDCLSLVFSSSINRLYFHIHSRQTALYCINTPVNVNDDYCRLMCSRDHTSMQKM